MLSMPFICVDCGELCAHDPSDPASGNICTACAQRAYDEAVPVPLTQEEIQRIVDAVLKEAEA